ncbi:MAG: hypothetical protein GC185_08055 [Alphaproteobacteria bacterium]|nr:hypothetical protein [Alphaproteobacteria bacterium]
MTQDAAQHQPSPAPSPAPAPHPLSPEEVGKKIESLRAAQNFSKAAVAGAAAALAGALAWAAVTVATKTEFGLMSVLVGYLVGNAVKKTGQGIDARFGYLGAGLAGAGAVLGNLLSNLVFYARYEGIPLGELPGRIDADMLKTVGIGGFQGMDLLFYGIAIYEGFVLSFKYRLKRAPVSSSK